MERKNSMENAKIAVSMVIKLMNAKEKPKFEEKCHKCKKPGHKASECRSKPFNLVEQFVRAIFV